MRYRFRISPLLILILTATIVTGGSAQELTDLLSRTVPAVVPTLTAEQLLEVAMQQDKVLGHSDSAVVGYKRIVALYRRGQARQETARRAQARLDWLRESGLMPASDVAGGEALPERLSLSGSVRYVLRATRGLELGRSASALTPSHPLEHRGRWLARMALVRQVGQVQHNSKPSPVLVALGSAADAMRRMLGLEGLLHFVEQERRRNRPRRLTPHEQFLSALQQEKENKDFGSACEGYRNVVQLSRTGGLATRLIERARQGVERCAEWQQTTAAGS
ncbi:MAG: hypothetical protein HOH74_24025 [Gemmatimonadetes bacterium]|jgi:hypothetical protein|nr:hypothetical protein [Gemmatimonadota bacterium]